MTREEIIEAIQHDNMMPFLQDWEVRDVVDFVLKNIQPSLPEGVEDAAIAYSKQVSDGHNYRDLRVGFIAGAEYQRKQDQSLIELAEDHAMLAGMNKMKEEMMEKAVDGRYMKAASSVYVESWPLDIDPDSVKAGDEMKLIVVPKEK